MANYGRSHLFVILFLVMFAPLLARADVADVLGKYVGYTIVASKTIAGYVDKCRISPLGTGRFPKLGTTLNGSPAEP